jgi:CheY-like chemotaxis protein
MTVGVAQESDHEVTLLFEVSDTGIGIPEEVQPLLFQPFTQADSSTTRKFGGTGLGLAISSRLVELMRGEMRVRSRMGQGSTFSFTAKFQKQQSKKQVLDTQSLADLRALVVDDNATNRKIVHHFVTSWGMRNGSAESGLDALVILRAAVRENDPYQVAILDYQMPGMDGLTLARSIKNDPDLKHVKLIMLTSLGNKMDGETLRRCGIAEAMQKPVRHADLFYAITRVLEQTQIRRKAEQIASAGESQIGKLKVLVAEDNIVNQKVALRQLQKLGLSADAVSNGREVLEALDRIGYDVVLMDCQMPEMDGYETTRAMRKHAHFCDTYIIAMTANAMQGDREKCLEAGMNDYVPKPTRIQDLEAALAKVPTGRTLAGS